MDVYDVAKGLVVEVPEMRKEVFAVYYLARSAHDVLEYAELFEREGYRLAIKRDYVCGRVERQRPLAQYQRDARDRSAQ